jgi:hypothetical protein
LLEEVGMNKPSKVLKVKSALKAGKIATNHNVALLAAR